MAHVFVIRGDLTRFECDAWLVPTPHPGAVGGSWRHVDGLEASVSRMPPPDDPAAIWAAPVDDGWPLDRPLPVPTLVPPHGVTDAGDVIEGITCFVEAALPAVTARRAERERLGMLPHRPRPLLAVPAYATKGGGGAHLKGVLTAVTLETLAVLADDRDVDVALVLVDDRTFAYAQVLRTERAERAWPELEPGLLDEARRLGGLARDGRLVPFMGAGVSIGSGGPNWAGLIERLGRMIGLTDDECTLLLERGRSSLDQAAYLRHRFEERPTPNLPATFNEAIAAAVTLERYALVPALIASLRTRQAITLNYDRLFEMASKDAGVERTLLPRIDELHDHWLLKLHGSVDDPEHIVLTRDDYLAYAEAREALSAVVKSLLITHHLLFVGFGLSDDHVHQIVHDVRRAVGDPATGSAGLATALTLHDDPIDRALWGRHVRLLTMAGADAAAGVDASAPAVRLEIFLDAVLAFANDSHSYLLDPAYRHVLTPQEESLATALESFERALPAEAREAAGWRFVERMLRDLGA